MNLGELKTSLYRYGFDSSDPVLSWLNAALHEFEIAHEWPFLQNLTTANVTAGIQAVVLPSDYSRTYTVRLVGSTDPLVFIPSLSYQNKSFDQALVGLPTHFTLIGASTLLLWPTPTSSAVVNIFYRKLVPDLAVDGDIPGIPIRFHYGLVLKAAAIGLMAENEEDRAQTAQSEFDSFVERAVENVGQQGGEFGQVQDVMDYF